ncbi:MAG: hypothetical protein LBF77_07550, partial [Spirochaetaceae bacterium]|nr:hypothetical protein [Spirochaetaceae bacterium]
MKPPPSPKKPPWRRALVFFLLFSPVLFSNTAGLEAQTAEEPRPAGGHRGKINALIRDRSGRIISAGEDGFIGIWDIQEGRAEERFQISEYA